MSREKFKFGFRIVFLLVFLGAVIFTVWNMSKNKNVRSNGKQSLPVGEEIARYKNIPAYQNGEVVAQSHGKNYAEDGYYYGQKWQCVEYVKRFYHDALGHHMPSVWGHAADFFDPQISHGKVNPARGLLQYDNGGDTPPKPNDLLVFRHSQYGHVSIVTKVTDKHLEVIQQNVHGHASAAYPIDKVKGKYTVGGGTKPAGWLRLP